MGGQPGRNPAAEPGAASRDQDSLARQQVRREHGRELAHEVQ
jgi:hypothetical protein